MNLELKAVCFYVAPHDWNKMPLNSKESSNIDISKISLELHLFGLTFFNIKTFIYLTYFCLTELYYFSYTNSPHRQRSFFMGSHNTCRGDHGWLGIMDMYPNAKTHTLCDWEKLTIKPTIMYSDDDNETICAGTGKTP